MTRPRLRRDYLPVCLDDALLLVGETRTVLVEDPVAVRLAPLLDGRREVTELMAAVAHPRVAVAKALRRLGSHDVLADGPTTGADGVAAAWDARGVDPELAERQRAARISNHAPAMGNAHAMRGRSDRDGMRGVGNFHWLPHAGL